MLRSRVIFVCLTVFVILLFSSTCILTAPLNGKEGNNLVWIKSYDYYIFMGASYDHK